MYSLASVQGRMSAHAVHEHDMHDAWRSSCAYGTVVDKNPTVTHAHVIVLVQVNTCVLRHSILIMNSILRNAQYNYRCEGEWEGMSMQAAVSEQQQYAHYDTDSVHKEEIPRSHTICPHVLMDI